MPDFLKVLHNKVFNKDNSLKQWKKEKSIKLLREVDNIIKNNETINNKQQILSLFSDEGSNKFDNLTIYDLALTILMPESIENFDPELNQQNTAWQTFIQVQKRKDPGSKNKIDKIIFKKLITEEKNLMAQTDVYMFIRLLHHFGVISDRNPLEIDEDGCLMLNNDLIEDKKIIRRIIKYMTNQPEEWKYFQYADKTKNDSDLIILKKSLNNQHTAAVILFSLFLSLTLVSILSSLFIGMILGNIIIAATVGSTISVITMASTVIAGYQERKIANLKKMPKIAGKQIYENMVIDREAILYKFKNTDPPKPIAVKDKIESLVKNCNLIASKQNVQHNTEEQLQCNTEEQLENLQKRRERKKNRKPIIKQTRGQRKALQNNEDNLKNENITESEREIQSTIQDRTYNELDNLLEEENESENIIKDNTTHTTQNISAEKIKKDQSPHRTI